MRDIKRRKFIRLASAFLGGLGLAPLAGRTGFAFSYPQHDLGTLLAGIIPANAMTRRTAEAVGSQSDTPSRVDALEREILSKLAATGSEKPEIVRHMLVDRIKTDFDYGWTVSIDGWRLSRTEADLIFLASKHRSG